MLYRVEINSKKEIWVYSLANNNLLGRLVWKSEDQTQEEFLEENYDRLIRRNHINNSNLLPLFLNDSVFAIQ